MSVLFLSGRGRLHFLEGCLHKFPQIRSTERACGKGFLQRYLASWVLVLGFWLVSLEGPLKLSGVIQGFCGVCGLRFGFRQGLWNSRFVLRKICGFHQSCRWCERHYAYCLGWYMGGCQNYGPLLGPQHSTAPNTLGANRP